ncbi:MAG TPA: class I SAM-dependent methyltransferase [Polyangiaceae bacterium]|nr:class I SAM-dependent methyltransferase [Polyangiaceae bacterium]
MVQLEIHYATDMTIACPLCRSGDTFVLQKTEPLADSDPLIETTFVAPGEVVNFMACQACSLVFRTPRPTPEQIANYYQHVLPPQVPVHLKQMGISEQLLDARNERRYALLFDDLMRLVPGKSGHIIDIGGWDGRSLVPWQAAGWETTLIDPGATETLPHPKIRALGSVEEAIHAELQPAKLITSYHCIEHLRDIDEWIAESKRLSNAETFWVIEVPFDLIHIPNLFQRRPLNRANVHIQHLNYFTPRSLNSLATLLGLEPMSLKIVVAPHWFGPTVALRVIARAPAHPKRPVPLKPRSARRVRASLELRVPVWRRMAGLMFRYTRLAHPEWG